MGAKASLPKLALEKIPVDSILVSFSTKYGATQRIAVRVANSLEKNGHEVTLAACSQVPTTDPFKAVVCGSAVYMGGWRQDAVKFVEKYAENMMTKPSFIFSSGPTGTGKLFFHGFMVAYFIFNSI